MVKKIRISLGRTHLELFDTFGEALDKVIEINKQGDEASLIPKGNKWQVTIVSK